MTDREAYIALNQMEGLGPIKVRALIDVLGSPQAVFEVEGNELLRVRGIGQKLSSSILSQRTQINPVEEVERAAELGIRIITPLDVEYPESSQPNQTQFRILESHRIARTPFEVGENLHVNEIHFRPKRTHHTPGC